MTDSAFGHKRASSSDSSVDKEAKSTKIAKNESYLDVSDDGSEDMEEEQEEDDEIDDSAALPILLLDLAEEQFDSNCTCDHEVWKKILETLEKAKMLCYNFFPDIKAMFDKARARMVAGMSEGKVPPGSMAVSISRVDMRYILSCIFTLQSKVAAAQHLHEGNDETVMLLREALIFFPRSVTANYLLARALLPTADTIGALEKVELCLRKAASYQVPAGNNDDFIKERGNQREAKEALSLLLCQAGKMQDSYKYLRSCGFTWRLSKQVFNHQRVTDKDLTTAESQEYAQGKDNSISEAALQHLRHVFRPESPFWKEHHYDLSCNASRTVGYFSYKYPLRERKSCNSVEQIVDLVYKRIEGMFPQVKEATVAEWWVHSRPHCSGHQLHFDSDETRISQGGKPSHPICSCILYLEESGHIGGPTLVTDQTLAGNIATQGWLCFPKYGRLLAFDAKYLHGVIPGHGPTPSKGKRRLTFMVGFWRKIEAKDRGIDKPGPGQPFPGVESQYTWHKEMQKTPELEMDKLEQGQKEDGKIEEDVQLQHVSSVWEPIDKEGSTSLLLQGMKLPGYTSMFQGF